MQKKVPFLFKYSIERKTQHLLKFLFTYMLIKGHTVKIFVFIIYLFIIHSFNLFSIRKCLVLPVRDHFAFFCLIRHFLFSHYFYFPSCLQ